MLVNFKLRLKKWKRYTIITIIFIAFAIANCLINLHRNDSSEFLNLVAANLRIYSPFLFLFLIPWLTFDEAREYIFKNYKAKYYDELKSGWTRFLTTLYDYLFSIVFIVAIIAILGFFNFLLQFSITTNGLNNFIYYLTTIAIAVIVILIYLPILCLVVYLFRKQKFLSFTPMFVIFVLFVTNLIMTSVSLSNFSLNKDQIYFQINDDSYDYKEVKNLLSIKNSKIYKDNFSTLSVNNDSLAILTKILSNFNIDYKLLNNHNEQLLAFEKINPNNIANILQDQKLDKLVNNMLYNKDNFVNLDKLITWVKGSDLLYDLQKDFQQFTELEFDKIPVNLFDYWSINMDGFMVKVDEIRGVYILALSKQLLKEVFVCTIYKSWTDEEFLQTYQEYVLLFFQGESIKKANLNYFDSVFNLSDNKLLSDFKKRYGYQSLNQFINIPFSNILKVNLMSTAKITEAEVLKLRVNEENNKLYNSLNVLDYFNKLFYIYQNQNQDRSNLDVKLQNIETLYLFDGVTNIGFRKINNEISLDKLESYQENYVLLVSLTLSCLMIITNFVLIIIKNKFVADVSNIYTLDDLLEDLFKKTIKF
ncbi:hypothetical protein SCLAR_v1c10330 [Spiroplasma clarkii]|uniref:Uncharacterized protein n=1 Tax=Spiroplasma clarkii TaxID=2139 RepID=A0A2K8KI13_9MOLU|nr:hypothetical protein SCLAR_v1c10330 [Spiroplasma clarkii]